MGFNPLGVIFMMSLNFVEHSNHSMVILFLVSINTVINILVCKAWRKYFSSGCYKIICIIMKKNLFGKSLMKPDCCMITNQYLNLVINFYSTDALLILVHWLIQLMSCHVQKYHSTTLGMFYKENIKKNNDPQMIYEFSWV